MVSCFEKHCSQIIESKEIMELQQSILNDVSQWPCILGSLSGFWPFELKRNSLEFEWKSKGAIASILLVILTSLCCIYLFLNESFLFPQVYQIGQTQKLGHNLTSMIQQASVFILVFNIFWSKLDILQLWNNISKLTEKVTTTCCGSLGLGGEGDKEAQAEELNLQLQLNQWISKCKKMLKILIVVCIIIALGQMTLYSATMFFRLEKDHGVLLAVCYAFPVFFWGLCTHLYWIVQVIFVGMHCAFSISYKVLICRIKLLISQTSQQQRDYGCNSSMAFTGFISKSDNGVFFSLSHKLANQAIWSCIQISDDLQEAVDDFNSTLRVQSLISFLNLGLTIVFSIFYALVNIGREGIVTTTEFGEFMSTVMSILIFYLVCSSATELTFQAQKFGGALQQLISMTLPYETMSLIQLASVRLSVKPPQICPGHIFVVNNKLIASLMAMMATYLVVLIQFDGVTNQN